MRKEIKRKIMSLLTDEISYWVDETKENSEYFSEDDQKEIVTTICQEVKDEVMTHSTMFGHILN